MIRPASFAYNTQTAVNNSFQRQAFTNVQAKAWDEFDAFSAKLVSNGVNVIVLNDTENPHTPDAIFPNNWISFHEGTAVLYPMFALNRRDERNPHVIDSLIKRFTITAVCDLTYLEEEGVFLEGTGSMVLDRENKIAYACLSPRTNKKALDIFCRELGYEAIVFYAFDALGNKIYHTNVMMCVADMYAIICLESITDNITRNSIIKSLQKSKKLIIDISLQQVNSFAGNMLQVQNEKGKKFLIMSTQAYKCLTVSQKLTIQKYNAIIHSNLATIEANGGGSARCMMAEIFI